MKITAFIAFLLAGQALFAQTFSAWPSTVLNQELAFNEANECYIYFDHPAVDTLHLKWRQLVVMLPEGWTADLCDYGLCYTGIPVNGVMNPAYDTIRPYLKLIVQPNTTAGSAWLWFRAIEIGHDANFLDVYFNLYTPGTVGVKDADKGIVRVFPNPASNTLFLENTATVELPCMLSDMSGKPIWQGALASKATQTIDLTPYSAGLYFLRSAGKTEKIFIQK
ncbi:MAG TPA: T9SS type A sorting domain-containing protein [Saprospiraceae bacterium]|nr:T9SS type A sorting domain-containing protein [Saprospiraceae bacterium]HPI05345.1 T9SS type A sorting domain-containing protein [Saprospiraceae bacterium]